MSAVNKGKQGTRGEKTIVKENAETLTLYRNIILVVMSVTAGLQTIIYWRILSKTFMAMHSVTAIIYFLSFKFMSLMGASKVGRKGEIIDCGTDLNMTNGMAEHLKDMILLCAIVQVLTVFSEWFWLVLLLAPARAFYLFWVHIAAPWIFAPPPEEDPMDEKRQRRMERRQTKFKRA